MFEWRNIIGLLALVLASAGPMPLWLHHAQCQPSGCCQASAECTDSQSLGHAHADCDHPHSHTNVVATQPTDTEQAPGSEAQVTGQIVTGQIVTGQIASQAYQLSSDHAHDCWVCYQLSQAAAAATFVSQQSSAVVASRMVTLQRQFSPAAICALCAPRGPPAVIGSGKLA